jgi:hypothetical protein
MNMHNMKDKLGSAQTPTSTPATVITATAATASGDSEIYAAYSVLMYATAVHLPRVSFPLRLRSHIGLSMPAHVHTDHARIGGCLQLMSTGQSFLIPARIRR